MSVRPLLRRVPRVLRSVCAVRMLTAAFRRFAQVTVAACLLVPLDSVDAQPLPTDRSRLINAPATRAKRKTAFVADLGYLNTSGNSDVTTISASERVTHTEGFWRFEQTFNAVYGQNAGKENTNLLRAAVGAQYALRTNISVATGMLYDRNRFSGIAQRTEEYMGLVFRALRATRDTLRIETGGSFTQQRSVDGEKRNFPAARGALHFKHAFAPAAYFMQNVETIPNLETSDDWRVNTESAVVAPLAKRAALKVSFVMRYDNLPEEGFQKTDRFLTTGLQLSF